MSKTSHWILALLALSMSAIAASVYLLFEIDAGLHHSFVGTLVVSVLAGVVLPALVVFLMRRLGWIQRPFPGYLVFMLVCAVLIGVLARVLLPGLEI